MKNPSNPRWARMEQSLMQSEDTRCLWQMTSRTTNHYTEGWLVGNQMVIFAIYGNDGFDMFTNLGVPREIDAIVPWLREQQKDDK